MVMNCKDVINTDWLSPRLAPSSVLPYHSHSMFLWFQFQNNLEIKASWMQTSAYFWNLLAWGNIPLLFITSPSKVKSITSVLLSLELELNCSFDDLALLNSCNQLCFSYSFKTRCRWANLKLSNTHSYWNPWGSIILKGNNWLQSL